jgi:hypothetical protein
MTSSAKTKIYRYINAITATRGRGIRSEHIAHTKSGKGVVAANRIPAWTAIKVRIMMLTKRIVPGSEIVRFPKEQRPEGDPGSMSHKANNEDK